MRVTILAATDLVADWVMQGDREAALRLMRWLAVWAEAHAAEEPARPPVGARRARGLWFREGDAA